MGDRLRLETRTLEEVGRAVVELPTLTLTQVRSQIVAEYAVVAIPAALGVQADQEQVGPLRPVEKRVGVLAPGQLAAQLGREPLGDRGPDQERAQVLLDPDEDLVGEVVEDEAPAAGECIDDRGSIRSVRQGEGCQMQARDPALGPIDNALDERPLERNTGVGQVCRRLLTRVAQVIGPQLDEPAVGPQAGERQRGVLPGEQDQMDERRPLLDEEAHQTVDRLGVDDVVVVENQNKGFVAGPHLVEQHGAHQVRGGVRPRTEQAQRRTSLRSHGPERGGEVADEPGEVVLGRLERQPGVRDTACREPTRDRDRLAVPGRCGQRRQAHVIVQRRVEPDVETGTLAVVHDRGRSVKLGPDQGTRDLRLGCCGRRHGCDYRWPSRPHGRARPLRG